MLALEELGLGRVVLDTVVDELKLTVELLNSELDSLRLEEEREVELKVNELVGEFALGPNTLEVVRELVREGCNDDAELDGSEAVEILGSVVDSDVDGRLKLRDVEAGIRLVDVDSTDNELEVVDDSDVDGRSVLMELEVDGSEIEVLVMDMEVGSMFRDVDVRLKDADGSVVGVDFVVLRC